MFRSVPMCMAIRYLLVRCLDGKRKIWYPLVAQYFSSTPACNKHTPVSPTAGISTCPYTCTTPRFSSYFDNFHLIDVHDHMRQGVLKLEQHWLIQNLVHRVLSTLFRVIIRLLPDVFIQHKCRVDFHEYVMLHWHSS